MLSNFSFANLMGSLIFGGVGLVAFVYGKKNVLMRPMIIGLALMIYPYFIGDTLLMYLIGVILSAALYFWR